MGTLRHVIFTSSDAKFGDFLIDHWLKSLQANVNLSNIDVVVIDYGLNQSQLEALKEKGVIVHKCRRDGHVTIIRLRDIGNFLSSHSYDQVLSADGGDIIFQSDISHLFEECKDDFRASPEYLTSTCGDILRLCFRLEDQKRIMNSLRGRKMINAGFFLGPSSKFIRLCKECNDLIIMKNVYGLDQVAVDYILNRDGFKNLDNSYNFLVTASKDAFYVDKGEFYFMNDEKIPVVHNAGSVDVWRSVKNFGYGPEHNEVKKFVYFSIRGFFKALDFFRSKSKAEA